MPLLLVIHLLPLLLNRHCVIVVVVVYVIVVVACRHNLVGSVVEQIK